MKILKYGDGYTKTVICDTCGSELEYEPIDVFCVYNSRFVDDNNRYHIEQETVITCPVCNHNIVLEKSIVQGSTPIELEVEPKPKKKWWQI